VAIVTGGGQGVDLGIARTFLREGAAVATCARSSFECCPAAEDDDQASRALHVATDVRDEVQLDRLIDTTLERFGRIDILVNNAGGQPLADIATASPRFIRAIVDLNLVAPIVFSIKVYQVMKVQDSGGSIINISSQASMIGDGAPLCSNSTIPNATPQVNDSRPPQTRNMSQVRNPPDQSRRDAMWRNASQGC
jgi:NAD(P)-dependent dehydrogenase (short-subunit alcohol dehydrogenase family)